MDVAAIDNLTRIVLATITAAACWSMCKVAWTCMADVKAALAAGESSSAAQRDRLARLVDSGDLDGARAMARGILEGEADA